MYHSLETWLFNTWSEAHITRKSETQNFQPDAGRLFH